MQQSDEFDLDALLQAQSSDDDDDDGLLLPDFERSLEDILNDVDSAEGEQEQEEEKDDDEDENNNHDAGHDVARVREEEKEVVVPMDPVGGDITVRNDEDAVAIGVVSGSERRTIDSPLSPARSDHGGGVVEGFLVGGGALQVAEIHQSSRVWDRVANGGIPRGVSASASFSSVALGWGGSGSGGGASIIRPSPRPGAALAWAAAASRQSTRTAASSSLRKTLSSAPSSLSDGLNTTATAAPITPVVEKDGDVDREQEEDAEEEKNIGEDNLTVEKEFQFLNSVIFQEELEGSTGRLDAAVGELSFHVVGALEWEGDTADMNSQAKGRPDKLENLPMEFGKLQSLVHMDLSCSFQLRHLPESIVHLSQLKTFSLQRCYKLENLPMAIGKLQSLVKLDLSYCSQLGCLPDSIVNLSQLKTFQLQRCDKLKNLPVAFGKLQSLVELDLSGCSQLSCLPDSIVHLSQLKTFRLGGCNKLESLPMEFGKLQSLVELDLSGCSQLRCLPDSIVHLSQLKTFRLEGCNKLENLPMEFGKLQSLVELDLSGCSQLSCLPDSIVNLSQLKTFRLEGCNKLENLPMEFGKLQSNSLQEEEEDEEEEEQQQQQAVTSFIGFSEVVRDPINEDHSSLQQLESLIGTVDDSESLNSDNASDEASSSAAADEPVWMEEHHERASQSAKDSGYRDTDVEYRHPGLDPSNRESEAVVGLQELSGNGGTETTRSRWQEEEKQVQNLTALDLAEEQEKRTASSGLHWEEGVAARPMQLEGIQRGPPAIGLLQLDSAGSLSHALASPAMRRDHGSPEALAVHTNLIAVGLSKGALLVTPSKYSATCSTDEMEPSKVNADQFPPPHMYTFCT